MKLPLVPTFAIVLIFFLSLVVFESYQKGWAGGDFLIHSQGNTYKDPVFDLEGIEKLKVVEEYQKIMRPLAFKPGNYEVAPRVIQSVIDPGDTVQCEIYFTGYGNISQAKFMAYFSPRVFDLSLSSMNSGWAITQIEHQLSLDFGRETANLKNVGDLAIAATLKNPRDCDSDKLLVFYDSDPGSLHTRVFTEEWHKRSPIQLNLSTKKDVKPGTYEVNYYFTYFNGSEWKTSKQSMNFKVRNLYERYQLAVVTMAILASLYSVIGLGKYIQGAVLWIRKNRKKNSVGYIW